MASSVVLIRGEVYSFNLLEKLTPERSDLGPAMPIHACHRFPALRPPKCVVYNPYYESYERIYCMWTYCKWPLMALRWTLRAAAASARPAETFVGWLMLGFKAGEIRSHAF